jgi:hypothetical protein
MGKPPLPASRHVLDHDPVWLLIANDSRHVAPEARARTLQAKSRAPDPGDTEIGAGEASAENVAGGHFGGVAGSHVVPPGGVGPVSLELGSGELVRLDLVDGAAESGLFEAQFETADS